MLVVNLDSRLYFYHVKIVHDWLADWYWTASQKEILLSDWLQHCIAIVNGEFHKFCCTVNFDYIHCKNLYDCVQCNWDKFWCKMKFWFNSILINLSNLFLFMFETNILILQKFRRPFKVVWLLLRIEHTIKYLVL